MNMIGLLKAGEMVLRVQIDFYYFEITFNLSINRITVE